MLHTSIIIDLIDIIDISQYNYECAMTMSNSIAMDCLNINIKVFQISLAENNILKDMNMLVLFYRLAAVSL